MIDKSSNGEDSTIKDEATFKSTTLSIANSLETIGTFQFDVFLVFTRTWRFCSVTKCVCALHVLEEGGVD